MRIWRQTLTLFDGSQYFFLWSESKKISLILSSDDNLKSNQSQNALLPLTF